MTGAHLGDEGVTRFTLRRDPIRMIASPAPWAAAWYLFSAGVVTSAALIMVAVFSIFATLPLVDLKILGIGTAAAVLIDATVVRGILLPASLALLGDRAWGRPPRR
jgi:putative drug exporter of the RND superfamily